MFVIVAAGWAAAAPSTTMSGVSVSADGRTVTAVEGGSRVTILRACSRESFMPDHAGPAVNPRLSPDGRYVLVARVWPFEPHGRLDQSTVLYDAVTKRSYVVSGGLASQLGVADAYDVAWAAEEPSTLKIFGRSTRAVVLPGPFTGLATRSRCAGDATP